MIRVLTFVLLVLLVFSCQEGKKQPKQDVTSFDERPYIQILRTTQDVGNLQTAYTEVLKDSSRQRKMSCLGLIDPLSQSGWLFGAFLDVGSQLRMLKEDCQANLAGILLTHGEMRYNTGLTYLGEEARGIKQVPVYAMPLMKTHLEQNDPWRQLISLGNIKLLPLKVDSVLPLNIALKVRPVLFPHQEEPLETVGFYIQSLEKSALYIPDMDKWTTWNQDFITWLKRTDVILVDGAIFQNRETPGKVESFTSNLLQDKIPLFTSLSKREKAKIHFIHFNSENPPLRKKSLDKKILLEAGFKIAEVGQKIFL